jgi:hypothetical protein
MAIDMALVWELMSRPDVDDTEEIIWVSRLRLRCMKSQMLHDDDKNHEPERCKPGECEYRREDMDQAADMIEHDDVFCTRCGWSFGKVLASIIEWTISPEWQQIPPGRKLEAISGEIDAR